MLSSVVGSTDFAAFAQQYRCGPHPEVGRNNTQASVRVAGERASRVLELAIDDVALGFGARGEAREHIAAFGTQHLAPAIESARARRVRSVEAAHEGLGTHVIDSITQYVHFG